MLAVPKTGTTAFEMALRRHADIIFAKRRKHMSITKYHRQVAPFLKQAYGIAPERVAVMRAPLEQLRSWYRYRGRDDLRGTPNSTAEITFDAFVEAVLSKDPPPFARIGSQIKVLSMPDGSVPIHHLFTYETQSVFRDFLEARFGRSLEIKRKNVSPSRPAEISDRVLARLHEARAEEFALYDRIRAAGGHLYQPDVLATHEGA